MIIQQTKLKSRKKEEQHKLFSKLFKEHFNNKTQFY